MPDFLLIAVGALVPILALLLALACGGARTGEGAGDTGIDVSGEGFADDARS